jgi:hypothetical protein
MVLKAGGTPKTSGRSGQLVKQLSKALSDDELKTVLEQALLTLDRTQAVDQLVKRLDVGTGATLRAVLEARCRSRSCRGWRS